jgi:hypothetical protein
MRFIHVEFSGTLLGHFTQGAAILGFCLALRAEIPIEVG